MLILKYVFRHTIKIGTLTVLDSSGKIYRFSGKNGPNYTVRFKGFWTPYKVAFRPTLAIGEGYMNNQITLDNDNIYDFLAFLAQNVKLAGHNQLTRLLEKLDKLFKPIQQFNFAKQSLRNVSHHYNLSDEFYRHFLDKDMQYSCAFFRDPHSVGVSGNKDILEKAQEDKKSHIAAKLLIDRGMRILDIGSGWGGMAIFLAEKMAVKVTGITLSEPQLKVSLDKVKTTGTSENVDFQLRDYRDQTGIFDRIVSVGMFEHVGIGYYKIFFNKIYSLLEENGVALLHTIGRQGPPSVTDPWIRKYIFPGGYIPALSEIIPAIEQSGLSIGDIEILGPHYARTISYWRERFAKNRKKILDMYDEEFCRMWEFYLAGSEVSFRHLGITVFQIQLVKNTHIIPTTRDYILSQETNLT